VVGTIPAGLLGLLLEHSLRGLFASPASASFFLMLNGLLLFGAEALRRRAPQTAPTTTRASPSRSRFQDRSESAQPRRSLSFRASRGRVQPWAGGLLVGLSHKDAARFSFLLATPIIGAAAALKLLELMEPEGNGIRGQALVAALAAALAAYLSVRFLMRYFETRTLIPFAYRWSPPLSRREERR
jgi:undecaprenyl-diphosphatase